MSRRPREQVPGAVYHVGARGNSRRSIFEDDLERSAFLHRLARVVKQYGWTCLTYCLMTNHFHLALVPGEGGLSRGMQTLLSGYSRDSNRRHGRSDHLFKQHFYSERKSTDREFLTLCRYIVLNPVRAGLVARPEDWKWSSYAATIGFEPAPPFFDPDRLFDFFDPDPRRARCRYRAFVNSERRAVSDAATKR